LIALAPFPQAMIHAETLPELSDLPQFYWPVSGQPYRVDPFIRMAVALQSLGRSVALDRLHAMAHDSRVSARVIVLARMLFVQRPGAELRRPAIGGAIFLGNTGYSDWPQEPIEVVDGVPFLITTGYNLGGLPETDEEYLQYCENNGDWSAFQYSMKTAQQKRDALRKLLDSGPWKATMSDSERTFLADQTE
jgi:hypothetical protein